MAGNELYMLYRMDNHEKFQRRVKLMAIRTAIIGYGRSGGKLQLKEPTVFRNCC
ncbi:MAG: hypothetical protein ABIK53_02890 [bacterium]